MAGFSFGTPTTSAPAFPLGSNVATPAASGFSFGSTTPAASTLQFNAPTSTQGNLSFSTPAPAASTGFSFGSTGGLSMGTPSTSLSFKPGGLGTATTQQSTLGFGAATTSTGLTFGSTPATQPTLPTFGSTPATQSTLPTFGSTPAAQPTLPTFGSTTAAQPTLPTFGSTPAAQPTLPTFGSTPAAQPTLPTFGSTPAAQPTLPTFGSLPATQPTLPTFGSTPAAQPTLPTFGSTPASAQTLSFGAPTTTQASLSFGSTPATAQQTLSLGNPATTQSMLSFGALPATSQPALGFGTTPASTQAVVSFATTATTQPMLGFGLATPAATTASTGFALGTPASTAAGLTTTATATPSLLNFAAPKTTATAPFSLTVSGAGTGTGMFALPTTSAPATTTAAPPPFKGLGGVDTSTTQGSGQKDAKSAKENIVNPEIMQTLDTFKNFVKQQKTLSCEVSRAPVKPMHKVTEDADGLKNLLTSVSSALQKNRVVANKLKVETTKCLSLCEMAQATHDTPPGLQNDNVAPLEFFIQLVSKFERDIQLLRQEIDNTEKHVNSLSYPAILTPQELSVALRRLHDSFVALAGRLQTAHAGVIAQKERHLSLRRHFLKDHTNIFETTSRVSTTRNKSQCKPNFVAMPGPTPFSSLGGLPNLSFITGQDKTTTFTSGNTTLPGWGSSVMSSLSTSTPSLLQSPGTLLSSPQPVDNQSFQLGKPPPGNKRGKR